jgi:[acyl-carrier-protein] S-malonyltransferase
MSESPSRAFLFPGQGSQFIGMGKDLAESFSAARDVFAEIDDALGQKLFALMTDGAESDLNLTENTQPALMAVSMAVIAALRAETGINIADKISYVAGHSLGEYSALTAIGAFDISTSAKLLKLRGQAMQRAVPVGVGAMAAILGLEIDDVRAIVTKAQAMNKGVVEVANDNSSGQIVISGHVAAVNAAMELATAKGAKRALLLPVSAPFHCSLMKPAADEMRDALSNVTIAPLSVPVVANVIADVNQDANKVRDLLVEQVTGSVRWRESVTRMKELGVTEMIEIGAGKVLNGLVKRIEKDIEVSSVGTVDQVKDLIPRLV